jgi:hypothetical protein
MHQGRNHIKGNMRQRQGQVVLASGLILLFSFLLVFGRGFPIDSAGASQSQLNIHVDHPVKPPLNSYPIPAEQESSTERDADDKFDDEANKLLASVSLKEGIKVSSRKCLTHHRWLSTESRTEISLIILHHSWKSFLS